MPTTPFLPTPGSVVAAFTSAPFCRRSLAIGALSWAEAKHQRRVPRLVASKRRVDVHVAIDKEANRLEVAGQRGDGRPHTGPGCADDFGIGSLLHERADDVDGPPAWQRRSAARSGPDPGLHSRVGALFEEQANLGEIAGAEHQRRQHPARSAAFTFAPRSDRTGGPLRGSLRTRRTSAGCGLVHRPRRSQLPHLQPPLPADASDRSHGLPHSRARLTDCNPDQPATTRHSAITPSVRRLWRMPASLCVSDPS